MLRLFSHAYDFTFTVESEDENAFDVTPEMLRDAVLRQAIGLSDAELAHACQWLRTDPKRD